jgi:hypothetical protein
MLIQAANFSERTDEVSVEAAKIYPNPVANGENIKIEGDKDFEKIEVINIVGIEVYTEKISPTMIFELNISGLDKGIYLLKILYSDNTSIIKRFWVK